MRKMRRGKRKVLFFINRRENGINRISGAENESLRISIEIYVHIGENIINPINNRERIFL
jgi:hypothetical protein